jgi:hypothetical protein
MNQKNLVLYGVKKGEKYEDIITETDTMKKIEEAREWAKVNGYEKLRFWEYKEETPDFVNTIRLII